jgi:tripartite-type tricarboxylate transporter receptor subunit TctC
MSIAAAASRAAVILVTACALCVPASAQTWPDKPIKLIVNFPPGGVADTLARNIGPGLSEALKQPVVVENRAGANGSIGADAVAKSPADGYTLLVMSNTHTVNESLIPKKPFALMKDFVPVAPINYSDILLVVHPSVPAKSVKELVQLAKKNRMSYASSGNGTPYHMAGELFKALAGVDILHVPHKGSGEARTSVMSGQTEMMLDAITTMGPIAKAGRVRALGTSGRTRSSVMPDVPTIAEAGVKGYETTIWLGIMAPTGTPKAAIDRLNAEITKVTSRADVKKTWGEQGAVSMTMTVAEFEKHLHADIAKWAKVVKISGAKADQ